MSLSAFFRSRKPDIATMAQKKDIPGLIRALRYHDIDVQMQAAKALGTLGPGAIDKLIRALKTKNKTVKLGIIGALSEIESPRSLQPLINILHDDNSEVRWQAALALGEIGDEAAIKPLSETLRDPDKYVRFGASIALTKLGWKPLDSTDCAYYFAGLQEWMAVKNIGKPAIPALTGLLRDHDSTVRMKVIELLGATGDKEAIPALMQSLGDENREVRWHTALVAPKCGVALPHLPRGLSMRPQETKSPWIAGFLNFLLPGTGYAYLDKWWGALIFSFDELLTVWIFKWEGDNNSYLILLPLYIFLGVHAWYMTTKLPKDPP
jgi:HEAT repeat protein